MAESTELIDQAATTESQARYGATGHNHATMKNGLKVDFVLVYKKPEEEDENDEEEQEKIEKRKEYEQNLEKTGLVLEHVPGTCSGSEDLVFVLIHAPWEFLCDYAEKMMIRVPVGEPDAKQEESGGMRRLRKATSILNPFHVKSAATKEEKRYITTFFRKDHMKSFLIEDKETFFDDNDRSRMVNFALHSTKYSSVLEDFGINRLLHHDIYSDSYRLHEGPAFVEEGLFPENDRQRLQHDWARFGRWYKQQPLNAIKKYLGIRVGLYFAWLGTYNFMLIFAAIVGLFAFIIGIITLNGFVPALETCDKNNTRRFYMCPLCDKVCSFWSLVSNCMYAKVSHLFDNGATVFFAVFMSVWSTVFLEVWKRKQISLSYQWDMLEFQEDVQPLRPSFVAKVKRTRPNPITGKVEPYLPRFTQLRRSACSLFIVVFMVLLVLVAVTAVVIYRAAIAAILAAQSHSVIQSQSSAITSVTASALQLVAITIMSKVYWQLAKVLTDWENPRTQNEYRDNITVKMFFFEFVNYYSSLFYIAFFKSNLIVGYPGHYNRVTKFRLQGCSPSGCLLELCIQLAVIMIGKQAFNSFIEYAIPSLLKWWKRRKEGNLQHKIDESLPRWEKDYSLNPEPDFRLFHQYLDMVIQFGFVTMFVAAFPLAPFFALINNIFELRIDAINFVVNFRRPVAERAQTIGVWYDILLALSKIAVVVNSFVIAFTSEFIPREVYKYMYSPDGSLAGYIDNSLSYFNVSDFPKDSLPLNPFASLQFNRTVCRYKGYHEPQAPYRFSREFFLVTTARLAFVMVFQYFVFCTVGILAWIIPDVPRALEIKIKRDEFVAKEKLAQSELEAAGGATP